MNKVYHGNNIEVLKSFEANSIDSIITDPPYGLSFMNKHWDYDVPPVELWQECLRVLKPGGHLLSFAGTRTYHRMTVRIEDAGFEIRDMISWIYGSGFPKSLDISKAIDKLNAKTANDKLKFTEYLISKKKNYTNGDIDKYLGLDNGAFHFFAKSLSNNSLPRKNHYLKLKTLLNLGDEWDWYIEEAEREVIGIKENQMSGWDMDGGTKFIDRNITAPATPEAIQWNGWGTALKPACEPICVARKPIEGTVANNVLKYGTGGINIDASRIGIIDEKSKNNWKPKGYELKNSVYEYGSKKIKTEQNSQGRFPANIIFDEIAGVMLDEMSGDIQNSKGAYSRKNGTNQFFNKMGNGVTESPNKIVDKGGASRFFYCAKASKAERNGGLEGFEEKSIDIQQPHNSKELQERYEMKSKNFHPTVKPLKLMQYLVRLVTPKGGVCLDPFCGSGTTPMACVKEGFNYIGIEREADYVKISEARIEWAKKQIKELPEQTNLFKNAI